MQADYGGFSPQRFAIFHFILHLSSKPLLKTWDCLQQHDVQQHKEYCQLCIGSDRENLGPIYAIICTILQIHGVVGHCPLCFFQSSAPSAVGLFFPLQCWILPVPHCSLTVFFLRFLIWVSLWMPVKGSWQKTLIKKGKMILQGDKIMMKAI